MNGAANEWRAIAQCPNVTPRRDSPFFFALTALKKESSYKDLIHSRPVKPQVILNIALHPVQTERLIHLQQMFAQACNHLSPIVQQTRCWNRVALHHMAYRGLRAQFPALGSQMACNAIYSVSRTCRVLFQNPTSPYSLHKLGNAPLPRVLFLPQSPVYFDRHTLSLKNGRASMYTLDGRMRFQLGLKPEDEANFHTMKLREIVLSRPAADSFELAFLFSDGDEDSAAPLEHADELPEYMMVEENNEIT